MDDDMREGSNKVRMASTTTLQALARYFTRTLNTHNAWVARMVLCELLNLFNVIGNIFLIDAFLGKEFSTYGMEVFNEISKEAKDRTDPMSR